MDGYLIVIVEVGRPEGKRVRVGSLNRRSVKGKHGWSGVERNRTLGSPTLILERSRAKREVVQVGASFLPGKYAPTQLS